MKYILETDRLILREMTQNDYPAQARRQICGRRLHGGNASGGRSSVCQEKGVPRRAKNPKRRTLSF